MGNRKTDLTTKARGAEMERGIFLATDEHRFFNRQDAKTAKGKPEKPILTTKDTNHTKWETGKPI